MKKVSNFLRTIAICMLTITTSAVMLVVVNKLFTLDLPHVVAMGIPYVTNLVIAFKLFDVAKDVEGSED